MSRDRLAAAVATMRELRRLDPAGFAILCSVIERISLSAAHTRPHTKRRAK